MSDFDFSDINLDFLQTTPPKRPTGVRISSPLVKTDINLFHKNDNEFVRSKKQSECAKKIASVDKLLKEIQILKCDKLQLQTQLKDFQKTALNIQNLYASEKQAHDLKTKALQELQRKYEQADTELVVKSLECEQFEATLADQKDQPVEYKDLVVKYLRLVNKIEGEDCMRNVHDRSLVEELKQYCSKRKIRLLFNSPKKHKSRSSKIQKEDAGTQCELLQEQPPQKPAPETKCQSTQCQVEKHSQGTQHISTMTTRSTTTSCFISFRSVGTNFPETQTLPVVTDILREFAPWQNIMPVSPIIDLPHVSEEIRKSVKTIGTCTWLCNIRRPIDFVPHNKHKRTDNTCSTSCKMISVQGIKPEVTTPSQSPTPAVQPNIINNHNTISMDSTIQLSQISMPNPSFHELWHIFGRMILGLLQTSDSSGSSAGIAANSTMNNQETINQHQFHTWLRELYDSSVAAVSPATNAQSSSAIPTNAEITNGCLQTEQTQHAGYTQSVGTSPLIFNTPSIPPANIARPKARKSVAENIQNSQGKFIVSPESEHNEGLPNYQNGPEESIQSNSLSRQASSSSLTSFGDSKADTDNDIPLKKKRKHKILDEIQELFPEAKMSKAKQKALKRLLKGKKPKKKSLQNKNSIPLPTSPRNVTNESLEEIAIENSNGDSVETAVDFLKGIFEKDLVQGNEQNVQEMQNGYMDADVETFIEHYEKLPPEVETDSLDSITKENFATNDYIEADTRESSDSKDVDETFQNIRPKISTIEPGEMSDHTYCSSINYNDTEQTNKMLMPERTSFTKPFEKSKNIKCTSKKQLYSSLFGDSDTELDEYEEEVDDEDLNSPKEYVNNNSTSVDNTTSTLSETSLSSFIELNGSDNIPITHIYTNSENMQLNNVFTPNADTVLPTTTIHNQNLCKDISRGRDISSVDMNGEIPPLFDGMDQETKCRLDLIISKQLEKTTQYGVGEINGSLSEEFPSDFEKDFELSSEEDISEIPTTDPDVQIENELSPTVSGINNECAQNEEISQSSNMTLEKSPKNYRSDITTSDEVSPNVSGITKECVQNEEMPQPTNMTFEKSPENYTSDISSDSESIIEVSSESEVSPTTIVITKHYTHNEKNPLPSNINQNRTTLRQASCGSEENTLPQMPQFENSIPKANKFGSDIESSSEEITVGNVCINEENTVTNTPQITRDVELSSSKEEHVESSQFQCESRLSLGNLAIQKTSLSLNITEGIIASDLSSDCITITHKPKIQNSIDVELSSSQEEHVDSHQFQFESRLPHGHLEIQKTNSSLNSTEENIASDMSSDCITVQHKPKNQSTSSSLNIEQECTTSDVSTVDMTDVNNTRSVTISSKTLENGEKYTTSFTQPGTKLDLSSDEECVQTRQDEIQPKSANFHSFSQETHLHTKSSNSIFNSIRENATTDISVDCSSDMDRTRDVTSSSSSDKECLQTRQGKSEIQFHQPKSPKLMLFSQETISPTNCSKSTCNNKRENASTDMSIACSSDMDRTRDVTTPNDELVIDEDSSEELFQSIELPPQGSVNSDRDSTCKIQNTPETSINLQGSDSMTEESTSNTSVVSSLLNSTLYREILTDSLCPVVDDILQNADNILKSPVNAVKSTRCGRKRKSECQPEDQTPCKRSERIKSKRITLEQSAKANSLAHVEIGKYTSINKRNTRLHPSPLSQIKKVSPRKQEIENEQRKDPTVIKIGFFKEIDDKQNDNCKNTNQLSKGSNLESNEHVFKSISQCDSSGILNADTSKIPLTVTNTSTSDIKCSYGIDKPTTTRGIMCHSVESRYTKESPQILDLNLAFNKSFILSNLPTNNLNMDSTDAETSSDLQTPINVVTTNANSTFCYSDSPQSPQYVVTTNANSTFCYSDSPQSPQYEHSTDSLLNTATFDIPLELSPENKPESKQNSLLESLICHFSVQHHKSIIAKNNSVSTKRQKCLLSQYHETLHEYCYNPLNLDSDFQASKTVGKLQQYTIDINLLCQSIFKIAKESEASDVKECELPSIIQEMPPRHFNLPMQRLFYLLKHLSYICLDVCTQLREKIELLLFNGQQNEKISLHGCHHLTQLYLIACKLQENQLREHPVRNFIAKCLYFYTIKAIIMILEILMWYPTVLPHREEYKYDRSDPLITVIQHSLMCYKYDMDKPELRGKTLLSKLRYEYHYEPFKPTVEEVSCNLIEKLKNSKFNNLSIAFTLFCKRLHPQMTEVAILQAHLLPLANEYYNKALHDSTIDYDVRISALLTIVSTIVKPFPLDGNIEVYLNLFSRFLNTFDRKQIQEAAVCAIMRLQRFGYVNCFNRLRSFKPTYELDPLTQAMFKTFIHRKKVAFLKTIQKQNPINLP